MQWALTLALLGLPLRCPWKHAVEPDRPPNGVVPHVEAPPDRVPVTPQEPVKPRKRIALPEGVVVRTLDGFRPSFIRCFERARTVDPLMGSVKVTIHLEIDAEGIVTSGSTDSERPRLSNCLVAVSRGIKFPAPGDLAAVDVPLFY